MQFKRMLTTLIGHDIISAVVGCSQFDLPGNATFVGIQIVT